jgi:hypothetical protein
MKRLFLLSTLLAMFAGAMNTQAQNSVTNAEYILSWDVCPTANTPQYRAEYYSVWISTTGNNPEDFATMLFDETLSTSHTNWVYENRQVNIDGYANVTVWVAFRHHDITDMDRVVIDNVKLFSINDGGDEEVVYLFEDFQGGIGNPQGEDWLPEGWIAVDADGDDFNWYFGEREGEGAMRSQSWDDPSQTPLTPDNYLITPSVLLGTVSVNQINQTTIRLFPNPATTSLAIQSDSRIYQLEILNMLGAIVLSENMDACNATIDVSRFNPGIYFLNIQTSDANVTRKINISR